MQLNRHNERIARIANILTLNYWECSLSQASDLYIEVNGENNYLYYNMDDWDNDRLYLELEIHLFKIN